MNGELVPAAVAVGGGSALAGAIYLHERQREAAMRSSRITKSLRFPLALEPTAAQSALGSLSGLSSSHELLAELSATPGRITHALAVPAAAWSSAEKSLAAAMGGTRFGESKPPAGRATIAVRLFVPAALILRTDEPEAASHTLLAGLAALTEGEAVVVRWALRPSPPYQWVGREPTDRETRDLELRWRTKTSAAGFRASGLILVRAASVRRARVLAEHVISSYRSRRGRGHGLRTTVDRGNRSLSVLPRTTRRSGWLSTAELLGLLGWALGAEQVAGIEVGAARQLLVPPHVGSEGRRLFRGHDGRGERPVAIGPEAARHHVAVVGPSGVGKSAMLARGILDDFGRGYGGAVIDPKSDLVEAVLDRVPAEHADRVVVLDPAADGPVPAIDVLRAGDPELASDVLVGAMRRLFPDWGIRSELYLRLAVRSLAGVSGATLADIGRLFFEDGYRRRAMARSDDAVLIGAWQTYEALSPAEQAQHVQAPMARIMALLGRPAVRAVLANPAPKLDVGRLLEERKWLLVPLSPGRLGEPAAQLIGSVLLYVIWSAIERRVSVPPGQRHPLFLYVDELATLAALPFSFELLAERARGLGAGLTIATQTLGRLPEPTRGALLGNVATLVTFRAGAEEATRLARELPGLTPADLQSLGRFEVAARIGTGIGSAVATMTGFTEPLPPKVGLADTIRAYSVGRYAASLPDPEPTAAPTVSTDDDGLPPGRTRRRP